MLGARSGYVVDGSCEAKTAKRDIELMAVSVRPRTDTESRS